MTEQSPLDTIRSLIEEIVPDVEIPDLLAEASLKEMAVNSIDRAEIIALAMERLGVRCSMIEFALARNIGELADKLASKL